jgi:hypothetical protein
MSLYRGPLQVAVVCLASSIILWGCGGGDGQSSQDQPIPLTVPKAACSPGDHPETALQGQVPAALRASGFTGFNCNLTAVGQSQGEGANWSQGEFTDGAGRTCAYHSSAAPIDSAGNPRPRMNPGVPVIDISDPTKAVRTTSLTTPAMLDPWESLRVNPRRQLLVADNGQNGGGYAKSGGPQIDIYDLSGDCRFPQLLASVPVGTGADGGILAVMGAPSPTGGPTGHEGSMAPDGLTYYIADLTARVYRAIDIANPTKPKLIAQFDMTSSSNPVVGGGVHGLSISEDGNRAYVVSAGSPTDAELANPNSPQRNGFVILDTSEVQARKAGATIKVVSSATFKDGSVAQHTLPIKVAGKNYLVMVDEGGSAGYSAAWVQKACDAKLALFPMARIYDITDETNPKQVSKLMLETHDPANCSKVLPDLTGLQVFSYGSHYCSVDNRTNATTLACGYFNSGVRVFDIRQPDRPKEVAYYNPAGVQKAGAGSSHQGSNGQPDWCSASSQFDFKRGLLITACQDNGLLVMKFATGAWPFAESTASAEQRN